eukprot:UN11594
MERLKYDPTTKVIGEAQVGQIVDISRIVMTKDRIRGFVQESKGWMIVHDPDDDFTRYATPKIRDKSLAEELAWKPGVYTVP